MTAEDKATHLKKQLDRYPEVGLNPDQVAEALGVGRRYVDMLLDENKIEYFVLDPSKKYKQKRVTKAALIAYILKNTTDKGE